LNQQERRNAIGRQLDALSIDWEFSDAIDARASGSLLDAFYGDAENIAPRPLARSEIACFASHRLLYGKIHEDNVDFALVLEDDALIDDGINELLSAISARGIPDFDALIVGYSKLSSHDAERFYIYEPVARLGTIGAVSVGVPWRNWTCGTVGYIVSRPGVEKLLSKKILTLADDWAAYEKVFDLRILHARPLLVFEDFRKFESCLQSDRHALQKPERRYLDVMRLIRGYVRHFLIGTALGRAMLAGFGCRWKNRIGRGNATFLKSEAQGDSTA